MKKPLVTFLLAFLFMPEFILAQFRLNGVIKDTENNRLPGVIVSVSNTRIQVHSDKNGAFSIYPLQTGAYDLFFQAMGYEKKNMSIEVTTDKEISVVLPKIPFLTDEVTVSTTRTGTNAGMAVSYIGKEEIEKLNTGQDMPYLMQLLPSVVITSDAGNGIGYTGIRIRGSDAGRVNVTINGIPVNDAESQLVYWVNMPDFASSVENIEVTRGAGVSTNGAGAFGGTINVQTAQNSDSAFFQSSVAAGSFNTIKNNLSFGTGLIRQHFSLEGRLSAIRSDGYIDRGTSDLKSFYLSGAWKSKNAILRLNVFSGKETTYQSWNGVPESRLKNDKAGMLEYILRNGLNEEESANLLNSGRTYNYYTYDDQTDNYQQDHYQLLYSHSLNDNWLLNLALHATKGNGYFEEYKNNQLLSDYAIAEIVLNDTILSRTNLIRRRWLDNWFYGTTWTLKGNLSSDLSLVFGGGLNTYDGNHFGEVIWATYSGASNIRHRYYDNNAVKKDYNVFLRGDWKISNKLLLFGDAQLRTVDYTFTGPDGNGNPAPQSVAMDFFNPKLGITWWPQSNLSVYGSVSVAQKEPNREDFTQSTRLTRPAAERMTDVEAGIKWSSKYIHAGINLYYMDYTDQLILTGKVNDVGNYTRTNVDKSYRAGIEFETGIQLLKKLVLQGNMTFSDNRIKEYIEYTDRYDADFNYTGQQQDTLKNTTIAFSPGITASVQLIYSPFKNTEASFIWRTVSKQYLDNTESEESTLPAYSVGDIRISYAPQISWCRKLKFDLLINNIFQSSYASNGYTFGYFYESARIREDFYYPQAGLNLMGQMTLRF